jgi:hypothetical protein
MGAPGVRSDITNPRTRLGSLICFALSARPSVSASVSASVLVSARQYRRMMSVALNNADRVYTVVILTYIKSD